MSQAYDKTLQDIFGSIFKDHTWVDITEIARKSRDENRKRLIKRFTVG
jgi:hypothetical protein